MTFKNLQCSWICQGKSSPGKRVPVERPLSRCVEADRSCQEAHPQREQEHKRGAGTELSPARIPGRGPWGTEAPQFPRPGLRHWHNCSPGGLCPTHTPFHLLGALSLFQKPLVGQAHELRRAGRWAQLKPQGLLLPLRPSDSPARGHLHRPN